MSEPELARWPPRQIFRNIFHYTASIPDATLVIRRLDMPSEDSRRTLITAIVVVLVLLGMAGALVLIAPKETPKSDVVAATQPNEIPAARDVVDAQAVAPLLANWVGDRKEAVVPGVAGAPPRGPRAVGTT